MWTDDRYDPEFDHVFRVLEGGRIEDRPEPGNIWAPEVYDEEIISDEWEWFSANYTGQYSYNGPIMHASEQFSGSLYSDVMETPGTYVLVVSESDYREGLEEWEETEPCGWGVLKLKEG